MKKMAPFNYLEKIVNSLFMRFRSLRFVILCRVGKRAAGTQKNTQFDLPACPPKPTFQLEGRMVGKRAIKIVIFFESRKPAYPPYKLTVNYFLKGAKKINSLLSVKLAEKQERPFYQIHFLLFYLGPLHV
jgi:hypothetical protein